MCLIIDANCISEFLGNSPAAKPVAQWLMKRTSKLALGGSKLSGEYRKCGRILLILKELQARGQIHKCSDDLVDMKEAEIDGNIKSDDPHIIAIAILSGARLLYSHDQLLHMDFSRLAPKGKIYQSENHAHLLQSAPCCTQHPA